MNQRSGVRAPVAALRRRNRWRCCWRRGLCWKVTACLRVCASVDADEIKRLGKRFKKLDLDNSGSLSVEEFMSLPELQQNPLVQRVIDIFDTDGNGEVDFKGGCARRHPLVLGTALA